MRLGETYVHGRDPQMARRLLAAAADLRLPPDVVRTYDTGFVVPDQVWDAVESPAETPNVEPF